MLGSVVRTSNQNFTANSNTLKHRLLECSGTAVDIKRGIKYEFRLIPSFLVGTRILSPLLPPPSCSLSVRSLDKASTVSRSSTYVINCSKCSEPLAGSIGTRSDGIPKSTSWDIHSLAEPTNNRSEGRKGSNSQRSSHQLLCSRSTQQRKNFIQPLSQRIPQTQQVPPIPRCRQCDNCFYYLLVALAAASVAPSQIASASVPAQLLK